ncbi:MAG: BON domain-containing protein [Proteobacteria bacterium]|nr:BON domain-containing protein [Pseudomonadota bacterium]MDA1356230.1 BON domain-containing protein [Pseudomonadota bacterium]
MKPENDKPISTLPVASWCVRPHKILLTLLLLGALPLTGCASIFVGAATTGGAVAVQERSIGDAVDDLTIRAELNQLFYEDNVDLLQSVSFNVIEGRVLLKGAVKKQEHRIHALELAWKASGVREVINEIQVTDQGGIVNYARDTWISTQLTAEMLFDKDILSINYNIETVNGVIYVVGIAQDQAELDKVVDHARRIENVKQVVSHVVMRDDPRRTPGP